ncbi:glycerophosphoryl diester phosphodiesterase [Gottschalkia acidurici 9a]|uniref:Glycerophosphoryl diester phosphodiesterase n=1 Tax=Gottschalkia acidurici (strain ATCC 7906 / DSM 604 / BCRC 14475 / CIP 104303 / KCTC 5404 / NCIMB 10678 / 9a) TaxID=1128398 RepID=K0AXW4_GOTA9|nr:glycerophosphodiester phosphodiesterase family protein [Gottschalkia acidurici]AFS77251.1 glycerophosphoryl diester phosphodiesterase [Gottschalkia acidurici 9a]
MLFIKSKYMLLFIILFITIFSVSDKRVFAQSKSDKIQPINPLVAHAGGSIYGFKYTNSLEALEESYKNGFNLIEIDFEWTSDGKVVAIHDWDSMAKRMLMSESKVYSLYEFKNSKVFQDLTLMDLDDLAKWLETKKDVSIITDMKKDNIEFLKLISQDYKNIQDQIIPQVYSQGEYFPVKDMGYKDIILTLYKENINDDEVLEFVKGNTVFAVTMPIERGYSDLPMKLKHINVNTYAHTVNDFYIFEELSKNGVTGIYTDIFHANRFKLN